MAKGNGKKFVKGLVTVLLIGSSLLTIGQAANDWKEKQDAEPNTEIETEVDGEVAE